MNPMHYGDSIARWINICERMNSVWNDPHGIPKDMELMRCGIVNWSKGDMFHGIHIRGCKLINHCELSRDEVSLCTDTGVPVSWDSLPALTTMGIRELTMKRMMDTSGPELIRNGFLMKLNPFLIHNNDHGVNNLIIHMTESRNCGRILKDITKDPLTTLQFITAWTFAERNHATSFEAGIGIMQDEQYRMYPKTFDLYKEDGEQEYKSLLKEYLDSGRYNPFFVTMADVHNSVWPEYEMIVWLYDNQYAAPGKTFPNEETLDLFRDQEEEGK